MSYLCRLLYGGPRLSSLFWSSISLPVWTLSSKLISVQPFGLILIFSFTHSLILVLNPLRWRGWDGFQSFTLFWLPKSPLKAVTLKQFNLVPEQSDSGFNFCNDHISFLSLITFTLGSANKKILVQSLQ